MSSPEFDRLLNSIREDQPSPEIVHAASQRVRERLENKFSESQNCLAFRSDFDAYRSGSLSEARKMLLEDHLHTCVACRREYHGIQSVPAISKKRSFVRPVAWVAVAAAAVVVIALTAPSFLDHALAPSGPRGTIAAIEGTLALVSGQAAMPLVAGALIAEGQEIRTGKGSRALIRLRDGSLVEMAERTELALSERWRGKTVRLDRGSVMVEAAKQRNGYLQIATADCLVSVKGTIFSVSSGIKGSRVSVVEGEVKVDHAGAIRMLHRGDQAVTQQSMELTSVASDVTWSENSPKYYTLLGDFAAIRQKIEQIPVPPVRYTSRLIELVPDNTVVLTSIPNLSQNLSQVKQIVEDRVKESPGLAEWWNGQRAQSMRKSVDQIRAVSEYLGDEILVAAPVNGLPVILAETKRPGLNDYLKQAGFAGNVVFGDNFVAFNTTSLPQPSSFAMSPFGKRILESYQKGAGILFSANMEQIAAKNVLSTNANMLNPAALAGIDNLRFVVAESKTTSGVPENTVSLTFSGARHGVANWLGTPGPMGSLEFISPDASFASAFVTRNPGQLLQELEDSMGPDVRKTFSEIHQSIGFSPVDDVAATLGGEATIAIDGPLLPMPSWKIAVEVNDQAHLQWAIEQAVAATHRSSDGGATLSNQEVSGRTYYTLTPVKNGMEVHYVFVDGYLLLAANRGLLISSINGRAAGQNLPRSPGFQAQLPVNGNLNFSALAYYNFGPVVGPVADQLKATGVFNSQLQQQVSTLTANRKPSLVYIYGEPDRILIGSRSGMTGFGLNALTGLASGHSLSLPALLSSLPH